jgi:hypothetical protein
MLLGRCVAALAGGVVLVLGLAGCTGGADEASDASVPAPEPSTTTIAPTTSTTTVPFDCPLDRVDVEAVFDAGPMPYQGGVEPDGRSFCRFTALDSSGFPYGYPNVTFRLLDPGPGYSAEQMIADRVEYENGMYWGAQPQPERGPAAAALVHEPQEHEMCCADCGPDCAVPRAHQVLYVRDGSVQVIEVWADDQDCSAEDLRAWSNELAELL